MVHVAVNKYDLEKINILEYAFGEGGHQKAYAVYAFINVDNCERPLSNLGKISTSQILFKIEMANKQDNGTVNKRKICRM